MWEKKFAFPICQSKFHNFSSYTSCKHLVQKFGKMKYTLFGIHCEAHALENTRTSQDELSKVLLFILYLYSTFFKYCLHFCMLRDLLNDKWQRRVIQYQSLKKINFWYYCGNFFLSRTFHYLTDFFKLSLRILPSLQSLVSIALLALLLKMTNDLRQNI